MEFKKNYFGDLCFQIVGVKPYNKESRESLDYFYMTLWVLSVVYQVFILVAFFNKSVWLGIFLDRLIEPYSAMVGGYGGMKLFYVDPQSGLIKLDTRMFKTRTGHRFILYWWLVFVLMLFWIIFSSGHFFRIVEPPAGTALTIAALCTVIAVGYRYGKYKINGKNNNNKSH